VGFSIARGNSETENLALALNATHPTQNDKITLYVSSINTTNNLATPSTVASLVQGGLRYDRNISDRVFWYAGADFMTNALQFLDLAVLTAVLEPPSSLTPRCSTVGAPPIRMGLLTET
jgi:hypothetical protein